MDRDYHSMPVSESADTIMKMETNIDDCSGENLGYVMDLLLEAGARDVYYTPVFMKKNRPAYLLSVICTEDVVPDLEDIIFRNTTTIGIRRTPMYRTILERDFAEAETPYGKVRVKICHKGDLVKVYPEYEDLKKICRREGISYPEMYRIAVNCFRSSDVL